jgi:hypothetical protein
MNRELHEYVDTTEHEYVEDESEDEEFDNSIPIPEGIHTSGYQKKRSGFPYAIDIDRLAL